MGASLRIHLFGEPRFEYGGVLHPFNAPPKTLPLIAFLLLRRHTQVARSVIAAALWPDSEHAEALANVRRHLHYAGKALPPADGRPWILADARSVVWNSAAPYWLDIEVFESESQEHRFRAHAAHLYSGDLFERCADEWIYFDRERLRSLQMSNLALLTADARARNAYLQALQYAQLMLALDPWREDALRSVVDIRALLGDRSGAAAEYERFAQRLQNELGVSPSEESLRLYERIRAKPEDAASSWRARASDAPIIGRANERAMLAEEWQRAAQGRGRLLLVGGEAGVGKTALVESLAAQAAGEGALVLRGGAGPEAPYQVFVDVVRDAGGSTLAELASSGASSEGARLHFFDAIAALLERTAQKPLLVILEDLHEADAATLDLLRYLTAQLRTSPVLFAGTYREDEVGRTHPLRSLRRQLARAGRLSHLALSALDRESVAELVRSRVQRQMDDAVIERLYEATGGNPLFLTELLHQFSDHDAAAIPPSVASIVERRLSSLSAAARDIAETAAVTGRACTAELAAEVTGLCEAEALAAFEELAERHIVRESSGATTFTFVHDIVRDAIYRQIPEKALRRRHERVGAAMRDLHADEFQKVAGAVARHLERGGRNEEAAQAYAYAAESALRVYALDEARHCAERAAQLTADAVLRARALLAVELFAATRGRREQQREILEALAALEAQLPEDLKIEAAFRRAEFLIAANDKQAEAALAALEPYVERKPELRARFLQASGEALRQRGLHQQAAGHLREAWETLNERGEKQRAIECYAALLDLSITSGSLQRSVIDETRAALHDDGDPRTAALIAYARGRALFNYDPAGSLAAGEEMLEAARLADDRWLEALAHRIVGCSAGHLHLLSLCERHLRRSSEFVMAAGRPFDIAVARYHQIQMANRAAFTRAAYEFGEDGSAAARACGSADLEVRIQSNLMDSDVAEGDLERAMRRGLPIIEQARRFSLGGILPAILYLQGTLKVSLESPQAGIETMLEARSLTARFGIDLSHYPAVLGLAYLCAGDASAARQYAAELTGIEALAAQFFLPHVYLWAAAHLLHFLERHDAARLYAQAAYRRYLQILENITDGPMREAFLAYRFNRAIVALQERGTWAPEPMSAFFVPWNPVHSP